MTGFEHVDVRDEGAIRWVVVRRPRDRNSIHSALMAELGRLLDESERAEVRALVFTGTGSTYFIGGADGVEMMRLDPQGGEAFSARFQRLLSRMEASPLILVAAINGLCFGGGFELALACDFRVASTTARIGLPEVKVGLIPGGGGTQRLPLLVGMGLATEMILSGRLYPGDEAARLGLVHRAVAPEALEEEARKLLGSVLRHPAYALSLAKQAVRAAGEGALEDGFRTERALFGRCFERTFFSDLMTEQLRNGSLQTSMDVRDLLRKDET
ncbi:MAG: enoyl-CoA hydratase/isomerase family protein [Deltaproteobacteria bacterium]|nr:enoyl-CoA hydratase/isomerase family protein [Deltaproteobacteria bacterium]